MEASRNVILPGDIVLAILGTLVPRVWIVIVLAIHDDAVLVTITGDYKVWVGRDHILDADYLILND